MPIVIMKVVREHLGKFEHKPDSIWLGTWNEAMEWCYKANANPHNLTTAYSPVIVGEKGPDNG